ncbi:hypothetical protein A3J44_03960 [candidate division WOR-1 bacterium RIFCSPHIGHO2_02_FULL_45_12]|nr:MAG: hypothetical protein A3J44_03960 [candidate division WOR-1 bacterium RIFCSPHIGHO2_02_FULL_45_12]
MTFLYVFIGALVFSLVLTPLAKLLASKLNILDTPDHRKIHDKPVPLLGGPAIFLAFALPLFFLWNREILGAIIAGLVFVLFGLFDDAGIKIRARYKIWFHLLFACLFTHFSGLSFGFFNFQPFNYILTACFITFMTNSFNMLDGMDGLVSGIAFLASLFFFLLALNNNLPILTVMSLALAGATLGFLKYNFNPASIFLGEGGSTLIGFLLAVFSLRLKVFELWDIALALNIPRLQFVSFLIPLIILGIPIFDTFFVFVNRFLHHIKMSTPGKDHSHHRIHLMGLSQKMTVLTLYAVQIILGAVALTMVNADFQQFLSLLLIISIMVFGAVNFLLRVRVYT